MMSIENTDLALVPALRFPEFEGEWERKKLGEISNGIMYGMNAASMQFDGKNKYLRITDIDENSRTFLPNPLTSPNGLIEEKYKLNEGDIVFTRTGASVGKSYLYNPNDGNLYFAGFLIKFSINKAIPYFVFSQTLKETYSNWVQRMSMRSGQPGINAEEYKDLEIFLPTIPEQKRIASFFTVLDQKLSQLKQKKNLLAQYKKGVMQQLFSQELRFKDDDGNEFLDWENKILKDLAIIMYGKDQKAIAVENGKYPILGTGGIMGKTNHFLYDKPSVLIGRKGTIDKPFYMNTPFWTVDTLFYTKILSNTLPKWLFFMFQTINWYEYNEASGVPSLSGSTIYKIKIALPCLAEQIKIANFLSAIDDKINQTQTQIQKTEQYKKGLLQKMFC